MVYSRNKLEGIVLGTILNDFGKDGFMQTNKMSLRKELFTNKKNAFVFGILESMSNDGLASMTPYDVLEYANEKGIKYGNAVNFASYMCDLAFGNYAYNDFKKYVRELVRIYVKEKKLNGAV